MKKTNLKAFLVSIVTVLMLGFGQTAFAGADVYHDNYSAGDCYDYGTIMYCWETKGLWHTVTTPSGNTNYMYKGDYTEGYYDSVTGDEIWYNYDSSYKNRVLIKNGEIHVQSYSYDTEYCYYGYSYGYNYDFHFANGNVTKDIYEYISNACD